MISDSDRESRESYPNLFLTRIIHVACGVNNATLENKSKR